MINPLQFMKLARGSFSLDHIVELFEAMGVSVGIQMLPEEQRAAAFQMAAKGAIQPNSNVVMLRGRSRDGEEFVSILVSLPKKELAERKDLEVRSGGRALEAPG